MQSKHYALALLLTAALGGCASDPLLQDDSPNLLQKLGTGLVTQVLHERSVKRCAAREKSHRNNALSYCRNKIEQSEARKQRREEKEAQAKAEALQRAFDERDEYLDTTDVIKRQVTGESWIEEAQRQQRSVVEVDKPTTLD